MKYIKLIVTTISFGLLLSMSSASIASAAPQTSPLRVDLTSSFVGDACSALTNVSTSGCSKGSGIADTIARTVVNIMSFLIGIVSVIMILISGFRYVLAGDDTNATNAAKNTLIYALVGLAIAVLAQLLVHEVLNTATNIQGKSSLINNSVIKYDS